MSLQADLNDFKLAHVIEFISASKKTGTLRVVRPGAEGFIHFRNGKAFFAASSANRKSIGERLVEAGKITRLELNRALRLQEDEGRKRRLGDILVKEGIIDSEELRLFIKQQIYDSIFDLCQWKEGQFSFQAQESPVEEDIGLSFDEWQRIKDTVSTLETIYSLKPLLPGKRGAVLQPEEWNLVCLIDGLRSVAEIIERSGQTAFTVYRSLSNLLENGLVVKEGEAGRQVPVSASGQSGGTAGQPGGQPPGGYDVGALPQPPAPAAAGGGYIEEGISLPGMEHLAVGQAIPNPLVQDPADMAPQPVAGQAPPQPEAPTMAAPAEGQAYERPWADEGKLEQDIQPLDPDAIAELLLSGEISAAAEAQDDMGPAIAPPEPAPALIDMAGSPETASRLGRQAEPQTAHSAADQVAPQPTGAPQAPVEAPAAASPQPAIPTEPPSAPQSTIAVEPPPSAAQPPSTIEPVSVPQPAAAAEPASAAEMPPSEQLSNPQSPPPAEPPGDITNIAAAEPPAAPSSVTSADPISEPSIEAYVEPQDQASTAAKKPVDKDLTEVPDVAVQIKALGPMEIVTAEGPRTAEWFMFTTPDKKGSLYLYANGQYISDVGLSDDEEKAILFKIQSAA